MSCFRGRCCEQTVSGFRCEKLFLECCKVNSRCESSHCRILGVLVDKLFDCFKVNSS